MTKAQILAAAHLYQAGHKLEAIAALIHVEVAVIEAHLGTILETAQLQHARPATMPERELAR